MFDEMNIIQKFLTDKTQVVLVLALALAAFCLYLPSETGCALTIPPDSSEYSISLANLFEHGKFGFTLNGVWYPSRYAPWFSLSCLTPAYLLSGGNPLCFHWAILGFSLAILYMMVKWGERIGLGKWSLGMIPLLLLLPDFAFYSRTVMTEIPYVAIFAASALVWLRFVERGKDVSLNFCLGVGALVAWGGMVRPTMLPMLFPFAVVIWKMLPWRERVSRLVVLAVPSMVYESANLCYNKLVFGSFSRSGYHYWVPVPCDFPNLLFNWGNVCKNARELFDMPIVQVTSVMMLVSMLFAIIVVKGRCGGLKSNRNFLLLLGYLFFQFAVLVALYGGFYWADPRFYISVTICVLPLSLYSCRKLCACLPSRGSLILGGLAVMALGYEFSTARPIYCAQPFWRQLWFRRGQIASQVLPENSIVIQYGDPNVLEHFGFKRRHLRILPNDRIFDYTYYMIAPVSIRNYCHPTSVNQVYIPELIKRGICKTPFPATVAEDIDQVKTFIANGKRVFIERDILGDEKQLESFKKKLSGLGLTVKKFGGWTAPELVPNPIRHFYDKFVLGDCKMDSHPEVSVMFNEIVRCEGVSR